MALGWLGYLYWGGMDMVYLWTLGVLRFSEPWRRNGYWGWIQRVQISNLKMSLGWETSQLWVRVLLLFLCSWYIWLWEWAWGTCDYWSLLEAISILAPTSGSVWVAGSIILDGGHFQSRQSLKLPWEPLPKHVPEGHLHASSTEMCPPVSVSHRISGILLSPLHLPLVVPGTLVQYWTQKLRVSHITALCLLFFTLSRAESEGERPEIASRFQRSLESQVWLSRKGTNS